VTTDHQQGLRFGALLDEVATEQFPLSNPALLTKYGEAEIRHANGSSTLEDILGPSGDQTYDSVDEVEQTILTMVSDEAIGRKDYTDRESNATGIDYEEQSI
jgi:hypothetical protein